MMVTAETSNGVWNENGTGSASCSGSVTGETEEQPEESDNAIAEQQMKEQFTEEQQQCPEQHQHFEHLENGGVTTTIDPYLDPLLMQEPPSMHMPHVVPVASQSYMYPGHYMFGLPVVDVDG